MKAEAVETQLGALDSSAPELPPLFRIVSNWLDWLGPAG